MKNYNNVDILKQILTNQLTIMTVLQTDNKDDEEKSMLEYEKNETCKILQACLYKKVTFNSLYGYFATDSVKDYVENDIKITEEYFNNKLIADLKSFIGFCEIKIQQNVGILRVEIFKGDFHFIYATNVVGKTDTELLQEIIKFYINKILSK